MRKTCDNCENQDKNKFIQDCNSIGYPLYEECKNWIFRKGFIDIPEGLPDEGLPIV